MATDPPVAQILSISNFVLLTTYRRDGTAVATPVWVVRDGDQLGVWTDAQSGKVKRIRNNPAVALAICTARGRPSGLAYAGRAELTDDEGTRRIRRLVMRKYWFSGRLTAWLSRRRGEQRSIGIRINVG